MLHSAVLHFPDSGTIVYPALGLFICLIKIVPTNSWPTSWVCGYWSSEAIGSTEECNHRTEVCTCKQVEYILFCRSQE